MNLKRKIFYGKYPVLVSLLWIQCRAFSAGPTYNFNFHNYPENTQNALPGQIFGFQSESSTQMKNPQQAPKIELNSNNIMSQEVQSKKYFGISAEYMNQKLNFNERGVVLYSLLSEIHAYGVSLLLPFSQTVVLNPSMQFYQKTGGEDFKLSGQGGRLNLSKIFPLGNVFSLSLGPTLFYWKLKTGSAPLNNISEKPWDDYFSRSLTNLEMEGYGAEFTAALNLVSGNLSFGPSVSIGRGFVKSHLSNDLDNTYNLEEKNKIKTMTLQGNLAFNF